MPTSIITSTGCCIPSHIVYNDQFLENTFYDPDGQRLEKTNPEIIQTLYNITGIQQRRVIGDEVTNTDIAYEAAAQALEGHDRETLDYIIVAQNFGDVRNGNLRTDMVPTIAARVKHRLRIKNPYTVAYDIPFGCPGWLQGMVMADYYIRSGDARRVLVIGAETLSRVSDPHDVDCMIFADGAGATLVEAGDTKGGILSHVTRSDTYDKAWLLRLEPSYDHTRDRDELYIKMDGHDIYKYALKTVPQVVKQALEKAGLDLEDASKILMHQANAKMDHAILTRLFKLYGMTSIPETIMPMIIHWAGNSSVATIPTLLDLLLKGELDGHRVASGDNLVFASVGAGMNVNAMVYQLP
ncbi:3-oxoacyl-ACP synthase III family protein [Desulfosarcina ovata]|uniref:3-oxoacyl-ACP synthase n=1 Tax=Desulfosarcina ovata subsp. ovata TaxID=2752305 RepID=A0A5K8AHL9_9BACT|nr:ketoacyl-ACP synthase III [Desulfosarcina ovata]BBO92182.1 3-oxoacyl-ACP synthase [Desulfosarcina ovata subsp. ovata]